MVNQLVSGATVVGCHRLTQDAAKSNDRIRCLDRKKGW